MLSARRDASRAALAEVRNEDREDASAAGPFFSGVAKMAFVFWYAIGTLSMTAKNWSFASSEKPSTTLVTSRTRSLNGVLAFLATASRMSSRVRFSISGSERNIF